MKVEAVLFDLDGVITDTAHYHYLAWKQCADSLGIDFDEKKNEQLKGVDRVHSLKRILDMGNITLDDDTFQQKLTEKNKAYIQLIDSITEKDILPGIQELLLELREKKISAIVCSASKNAPAILRHLGLYDCFDAIVDPSTLRAGKPAPDIFLKGAQLAKSDPAHTIGIEDAVAGIQAIKAAGMHAVGVGGNELKAAGADRIVPSTDQLSVSYLETI